MSNVLNFPKRSLYPQYPVLWCDVCRGSRVFWYEKDMHQASCIDCNWQLPPARVNALEVAYGFDVGRQP